MFTSPAYAAVRDAVAAAGGVTAAGTAARSGSRTVDGAAADDAVRRLGARARGRAAALGATGRSARYAAEVLSRLEVLAANRRIAEVKSRLQRLNPVEQSADYNRLFGELVALEAHRRALRERAIGTL